jgi:co-chaperonin GroES (HSP10)
MTIKPLTGQVLVEMLPPETESAGGIVFPQRSRSPEELTQAHDPSICKEPPAQAVVRAIGPWPQKNGKCVLPEFGIGARVVVSAYSGQKLRRGIGENFKLVNTEDVLAVLTELKINPEWEKLGPENDIHFIQPALGFSKILSGER